MAAKEELFTLAQVAATLIGFSGLIFVFRARDVTGLSVRDLSGLAMIAGAGVLVLTFALVPLPLAYVGLSDTGFWRLCSLLFGGALLATSVVFTLLNRRLARSGHAERSPGLNRVSLLSMVTLGAALTASAFEVIPPGPALYLAALVVYLLLCLVYVAFMFVFARRPQ